MIEVGKSLPDTTVRFFGEDGLASASLHDLIKGKRIILFAVPGAFTPTCDSAHMPSFVRNADALREKGIDEIICLSVNDVHVMRHWGESTGAKEAGILLLADADAAFTKAVGLAYDNEAAGMFTRSRRYALVAEDGIVTQFNLEEPGVCAVSTGEAILDLL